MASLGRISVGMSLDATQFDKGLSHVHSEVRTLAGDVDRMGGMLKGSLGGFNKLGGALKGLVVGFSVYKVSGDLYDMAKAAAHAEESVNSLGIVFGDQADKVRKFAGDMARGYKVGLNSMLDSQNQIGSIFQGVGFKGPDVQAMTEGITRISMDMARLKDVTFEMSKEKFLSGLTGEQEPLKAFGIVFNEATVKAKALEMGMGGLNGVLTEQEKVLARYKLFVDKTAFAMGTATREAKGAAAQFEALGGAWENFSITVGELVAPKLASFLGDLSDGLQVADRLWKDNEASATSWLTSLTSGLGVATTEMGAFAEAVGLVGDSVEGVGLIFKDMQSKTTWGVGKGAGLLGAIIGENDPKLADGGFLNKLGVGDFFKVWSEDLDRLANDQQGKLEKALVGPSFSERVKKAFEEIRAEGEATRQALAKRPITIPTAPKVQRMQSQQVGAVMAQAAAGWPMLGMGGPLGLVGGMGAMAAGAQGLIGAGMGEQAGLLKSALATGLKGDQGFSGIARAGSQEATSTILRTRYSGTKDPVARNTQKTADGVAQLVKAFERGFKIREGMPTSPQLIEI